MTRKGSSATPPAPKAAQTPKDRGASSVSGPSAVSKGATSKTATAAEAQPAAPLRFDPPADWDAFFKPLADVSEAQILLDIGALRGRKDFVAIEKALTAYLKYFGAKHAAPWMYEQLAAAMEINGGKPADIKTAVGWGAHLALRSKDPVALIAACDQLLLRKYDEIELPGKFEGNLRVRLADVLDAAMTAAPHRAEPILMSLVFAENQNDPKRMAESAEHMLALGWLGRDATWRAEIPKRVRNLAKRLKAEGRETESQALLARLPAIEARDLVVRLTWTGDAALDLVVDEPFGVSCDHFTPRTVFGGALIKEGRGRDKEAVYVCPRAFDGDYTIHVKTLFNDPKKPAQIAKIEIVTHEGTDNEKVVSRSISLTKPSPVVIRMEGGRRKEVLPYQALNQIKTPEGTSKKTDAAQAEKAAKGAETKPK